MYRRLLCVLNLHWIHWVAALVRWLLRMLQVARSIIPGWSCTDLHYARGAQLVLPMRVVGETNQLDVPSLTPLSVAACGRLKLGVSNCATSVDYCKLLIIDITFGCSRFSPGWLLAIEDFTFIGTKMYWRPSEPSCIEVCPHQDVLKTIVTLKL